MESKRNYGMVLVTVNSLELGKTIAHTLLNEKLAACINMFPVTSLYLWQGKVNNDQEYQLLIKTDLERFSELAARIRKVHTYEVPEIIAFPIIDGSESYLNWIGKTMN